MATSPLPSWRPTNGRNCCVTPAFSRVPKQGNKIRSGCLTTPFSGAQKWAELLRHTCSLGGPETHSGEQNQKWLPHHCFLGGPTAGGIAMPPLHSRGSPTPARGTKLDVVAHPYLLGAHKWAELLRNPGILRRPQTQRGEQNQRWLLTRALSEAHKWAELLCNPCILKGPQTREQNRKWLRHHGLVAGPQVGGNAT